MSVSVTNGKLGRGPIKPPDKGSFPVDHLGLCSTAHKQYMECLKRNMNDASSCRHLSREYLKCRMDHNLMAREDDKTLGFQGSESNETPARISVVEEQRSTKEADGWLVARDAIWRRGWVKPTLFSELTKTTFVRKLRRFLSDDHEENQEASDFPIVKAR